MSSIRGTKKATGKQLKPAKIFFPQMKKSVSSSSLSSLVSLKSLKSSKSSTSTMSTADDCDTASTWSGSSSAASTKSISVVKTTKPRSKNNCLKSYKKNPKTGKKMEIIWSNPTKRNLPSRDVQGLFYDRESTTVSENRYRRNIVKEKKAEGIYITQDEVTGAKRTKENRPMITPPDVYWGPSTLLKNEGNGVFAARNFEKGEIVEIAPILREKNKYLPEEGAAANYTMELGQSTSCFMLGYGSVYNHHDNNNLLSRFGGFNTIIFVANRDIEQHEELFINYGKGWWNDRKDQMSDLSDK